ncbi:hypothetical protein FPV67DRAFT_1457535 [Lyophyllum atratum]|nr:hypothetical protein FPV67DRAFT_1457535 [Lyophyllum atratum]
MPQLRPRKAGRANQQLRASASTPSVQEFEQLHRVEPLMVRDEVETQNKGKPVWVEFYDNDDVFVRHVDIPTKPEPGDYWKAKIQAVRSDHGTGKTWVAVKWYYSRTDFEDTKWKTSLEKAIIPCLGDAELVLSDHVDIIEPRCIESPLKVVAFNDLLRVSHVPRGAWFMRLTVELSTAKRGSLKGVNGSCVCGQIYDPKEDIQRYCPECECWYHHACMDINVPYERDATLSPAAAIAQIPCVRGLTSHTGSVSGPGARLSELEGWLEEDKLPDNWRERLGERMDLDSMAEAFQEILSSVDSDGVEDRDLDEMGAAFESMLSRVGEESPPRSLTRAGMFDTGRHPPTPPDPTLDDMEAFFDSYIEATEPTPPPSRSSSRRRLTRPPKRKGGRTDDASRSSGLSGAEPFPSTERTPSIDLSLDKMQAMFDSIIEATEPTPPPSRSSSRRRLTRPPKRKGGRTDDASRSSGLSGAEPFPSTERTPSIDLSLDKMQAMFDSIIEATEPTPPPSRSSSPRRLTRPPKRKRGRTDDASRSSGLSGAEPFPSTERTPSIDLSLDKMQAMFDSIIEATEPTPPPSRSSSPRRPTRSRKKRGGLRRDSSSPSGSSTRGSGSSSGSSSPERFATPERTPAPDQEGREPVDAAMDPLDEYFLDPNHWATALRALRTLKDRVWIETTIIDMWLMRLWLDQGRQNIRYVPTIYVRQHAPDFSLEEILRYRRLYRLLVEGRTPLIVISGVLHIGGNHFCAVIFEPEAREIHVLGRRYMETSVHSISHDWDEWGGRQIWRNLATLHGWEVTEMTVREVNWQQNGFDCGPIACQVLEHIWNNGFERTALVWNLPPLPCVHPLRLRMATSIHQQALTSLRRLRAAPRGDDALEALRDRLDSDLEERLCANPGFHIRPVDQNLQMIIRNCQACRLTRRRRKQPGNNVQRGERPEHDNDVEREKNRQPGFEEGSDADGSDGEDPPAIRNKRYHVQDWDQAAMDRFPRPINPVDLPDITCPLRLMWRSSDRDFDEYEQGPTLEALEPVEDLTLMEGNLNLVYLAERIISNPWTTFKDYGYRLEPKFLQQFYLAEPVLTQEHMMVVGLRQPSSPSDELESTIQKTRRGDLIQVFDRVIMGAQEMIDAADAERDDSLFVTGTTSDNKYIYVDLCRDAVPISEEDYVRSCDIDSLIWISKHPRVAQAANIFTAPVIRNRAPIAKHNHVYVDVLRPPSEDDRRQMGSRAEWVERRFRLSRIPHLALGKMGDAGCNVNILMFFPRMPHQHPHTHRWANNLPPHLLNLFWDQVVIPAMRSTTDQYRHAHVGLDRDHVTFKQRKGAQNKVSTVPFQPDAFWQLTKSISDLITSRHDDEGEEDLEMFGSAFYVFEVKGSQKHTSNTESEEKPLEQSLRQAVKDFRHQFSCLDWEYMEDRDHGELIIPSCIRVLLYTNIKFLGMLGVQKRGYICTNEPLKKLRNRRSGCGEKGG